MRPSGVTQLKLAHGIRPSLLKVDVPEEEMTNDRINAMDDFSKNVTGIKTELKQRLFQIF
jgi:hypothetical protein